MGGLVSVSPLSGMRRGRSDEDGPPDRGGPPDESRPCKKGKNRAVDPPRQPTPQPELWEDDDAAGSGSAQAAGCSAGGAAGGAAGSSGDSEYLRDLGVLQDPLYQQVFANLGFLFPIVPPSVLRAGKVAAKGAKEAQRQALAAALAARRRAGVVKSEILPKALLAAEDANRLKEEIIPVLECEVALLGVEITTERRDWLVEQANAVVIAQAAQAAADAAAIAEEDAGGAQAGDDVEEEAAGLPLLADGPIVTGDASSDEELDEPDNHSPPI